MVWQWLKYSFCCCSRKNHNSKEKDDVEKIIVVPTVWENIVEINQENVSNLIDLLSQDILNLKNELKAISEIIIVDEGYFSPQQQQNPKTLTFISNSKILNLDKIKKHQSKVILKSTNFDDIICTIKNVDENLNILELQLRKRTNLTKAAMKNGIFQAILWPNYDQMEFIENGFLAIIKDKNLQQKIWIDAEKKVSKNIPKIYLYNENKIIEDIVKSGKTLICAEKNADIEKITLNLKQDMPNFFNVGSAIRLVTRRLPNTNPALLKCTKTFYDANFASAQLIICTVGVAPKLANSCNFSNIFIMNAETISEMDSWMIIGTLGNLKTNIFLCGHLVSGKVWGTSTLSGIKKDGCISMFERLAKLSIVQVLQFSNAKNDKNNMYVIEI